MLKKLSETIGDDMEFDGTEYNEEYFNPDPKPSTIRDKPYLSWLKKQPCVYSGMYAIEDVRDVVYAHDTGGGVANKDDDTKALPLLSEHHTGGKISEHNIGHETFWGLVFERTGKTREQLVIEHRQQYKEGKLAIT